MWCNVHIVHYYLSASLDTLLAIYHTAAFYFLFLMISYKFLVLILSFFWHFCCNSAVHIKQKDGTRWLEYPISIWYSNLYPLTALQFMFLRDPSPVLVYPCQQYTKIFNSAFEFQFSPALRAARTEQPAVAEMPTHSFVQPATRLKPWASQQAPRWVNQIWGE